MVWDGGWTRKQVVNSQLSRAEQRDCTEAFSGTEPVLMARGHQAQSVVQGR